MRSAGFYYKNNKRFSFFAVCVVLCGIMFSGCSRNFEKNAEIVNFVFNVISYNKNGVSYENILETSPKNVQKDLSALYRSQHFIYDELADKFLLRHTVSPKNRSFIYLFECYNPEYTAILECSSFYSEACDNASWTENLVSSVYDEIAQAHLTDTLLQLDGADSYGIDVPYSVVENDETPLENEVVSVEDSGKRWMDSENRLKLFIMDEELFMPYVKGGMKSFVSKYKSNVTRSFYDEDYRLSQKEYWLINSANDYSLQKKDEFIYPAGSILPEKRITTSKDRKIIAYYTKNGFVRRSDVYGIYKKDGEAEKNETSDSKEYLISKSLWQYNENKKLTIEEITEYTYADENYEKPVSAMVKRQDFIFNEDENIPPDYKYYENGRLKMHTEYESKGTYVSRIFFDEFYSVVSYFNDGKHVKDVYYYQDVIRREQNYE